MEKINIAELLKNCPSGMELGCTMFENLEFDHIDKDNKLYPIRCRVKTERGSYNFYTFTEYGCYGLEKYSKCVIFPKGKTTWEGFVPPCKFKDGDIVVTQTFHNFIFYSIYQGVEDREVLTYVDYYLDGNKLMFDSTLCFIDEIVEQRFATEEERQKLFDAIKANGYKWNAETKILEKLIKPKFKVGDRVKKKDSNEDVVLITDIADTYYIVETKYGMEVTISMSIQNNYELVPYKFDINTLKPFDKVLVRNKSNEVWTANFYSHYDATSDKPFICVGWSEMNEYRYCIPYDVNKELLGTTNNS